MLKSIETGNVSISPSSLRFCCRFWRASFSGCSLTACKRVLDWHNWVNDTANPDSFCLAPLLIKHQVGACLREPASLGHKSLVIRSRIDNHCNSLETPLLAQLPRAGCTRFELRFSWQTMAIRLRTGVTALATWLRSLHELLRSGRHRPVA